MAILNMEQEPPANQTVRHDGAANWRMRARLAAPFRGEGSSRHSGPTQQRKMPTSGEFELANGNQGSDPATVLLARPIPPAG
ncbi:hypothetical protein FKM82_030876 [Ascaphus truei]